MNSDVSLCKSALLTKLLSGKSRKMTRAAIHKHLKNEKTAKDLSVDEAQIQIILDELLAGQFLTHKPSKTGGTYEATDLTDGHLKTLPLFPPLPPVDPKLKSFILMGMLAAGDRWLLRKELKALVSPTVAKTLGFSRDAVTPLMKSLLLAKCVEEQDPVQSGKDDKVSYHLTAQGKRELAQGEQHPLACFKLTGAAVNELLQLKLQAVCEKHAAEAGFDLHPASAVSDSTRGKYPPAAHAERPIPTVDPVRPTQPGTRPAHLSDDALLNEAKGLLRDRHSHTGLVPIFELRERIKVQFGDLAASHEELDTRLRRLRREHRLRLVSISDRSQATAEQLSGSVPGEDEMFYYVGELQ